MSDPMTPKFSMPEEVNDEADMKSEEKSLLSQIIAASPESEEQNNNGKTLPSIVIGELKSIDDSGRLYVEFVWQERTHCYLALSQVAANLDNIRQQCGLVFQQGDISQPVITGFIQSNPSENPVKKNPSVEVIEAEDRLVLQCGAARIELHEDGEVNIQGMYINSQAYGPHRIKGGSVKIN